MDTEDTATQGRAFVEAGQPWTDPELALLYDAFPFEDDLDLYRDLARSTTGDVLELGAGTGRVLIALAAAGCRMTGLDASPHMLHRAAEKIQQAGPDVAARVQLVEGDMRSFRLDRQFALAIMPVKTFFYFTSIEEQRSVLSCVAAHLAPGGLFALDLLNPTIAWLAQPSGVLRHDLVAYPSEMRAAVSRSEAVLSTCERDQTRTMLSIYDIVSDNGSSRKRLVEWRLRYTFRFEAQLLLEDAGFQVEAVHGNYNRGPFEDVSRTMLLVARKL